MKRARLRPKVFRLAALGVRVAAAGLLTFVMAGSSPAQDKDESGVQSRGLRERAPRPPFPPGPVVPNGALACTKDQGDPQGTNGRDLSGFIMSGASMTNAQCRNECAARGFSFAGTQAATYCFCGNSYGRSGLSTACTSRCSGNPGEICGGIWANSVSITEAVPTAPSPPSNGGQCVIDIKSGATYRHKEIHRWEVTGPGVPDSPGKLYPVRWSMSGSGFKHESSSLQQRDAAWTVAGARDVQFRAQVRASDGMRLIQQVGQPVAITNGITGTQQLTISGVPQNPGALGVVWHEYPYPAIVAAASLTVITHTLQNPVTGSLGYEQVAGATATISCQWRFVL